MRFALLRESSQQIVAIPFDGQATSAICYPKHYSKQFDLDFDQQNEIQWRNNQFWQLSFAHKKSLNNHAPQKHYHTRGITVILHDFSQKYKLYCICEKTKFTM